MADYIELEYIKSTGTQYIDTGIKCKSTLRSQVKFSIQKHSGGTYFGNYGIPESNCFRFFTYSGTWYLDFGSGESYNRIYGGSASLNTIYNIEFGNRYVKNLDTDNNIISSSVVSSFTKSYNFLISDYNEELTIYSCKIYDDNELVRDLIPVKRKSDGSIGMLDIITNTFFINSGTGNFIAGQELEPLHTDINLIKTKISLLTTLTNTILGKYKYVEYVQSKSSGTNGFAFNYTSNSNTKIEMKMMVISTSAWNQLFSNYNGRGVLFDRHDTSSYRYYINDGSHRQMYQSLSTNTIYTYELTNSYTIKNGSKSTFGPYTYTANTNNFYILAGGGRWRIYYFKIYDNDELLFDLVPAYNTKNQIGLLNKVDNTFILGSGSFDVGPEIQ